MQIITIKVPASSQVLPGSDLETMGFPFLGEPSSSVYQPSRDESIALNSNPFVLKLPLLQGQADSLSQSLSGQLAS